MLCSHCLSIPIPQAHSGRINATSVLLQGSKHLGGRRVELNLNQVTEGEHLANFSLFPGQVVAVEGINSTGRKLTAHRICEGAAHGSNKSTAKQLLEYHHSEDYQNGMPLKIVTVAGPYTTTDNLNYDPLYDFMNVVMEEQPDVVIMVGPFVDLRHKDIALGEAMLLFQDGSDHLTVPFETFFANKIAGLLEEFFEEGDAKTQFVLVPSLDDATAEWVFPQAPFQDSLFGGHRGKVLKVSGGEEIEVGSLGLRRIDAKAPPEKTSTRAPFHRVHCVSNPCTLTINEVIIGVTGTDAIFHMSADETNANLVPGSRLARISQHMLQQRSYYPLFPAAPGTSLDLKRMQQWSMPCQPDVLIVPSKLATFATPVLGDTVVINPGQLSKNTTGGTYGIMEIHPMKRDDLETAGGDDVELDHNIADRMVLEIRKI
jgi:DNA polymerase alpha subunit B